MPLYRKRGRGLRDARTPEQIARDWATEQTKRAYRLREAIAARERTVKFRTILRKKTNVKTGEDPE